MHVPIKKAYIWPLRTPPKKRKGGGGGSPLGTRARRVLVWLLTRYLQSSPNKIKDAHGRAHKHNHRVGLKLPLHKNTFSGTAFTLEQFSRSWLTECTCSNMCSGVSNSSSKQIANRTDRKYALFAQRSSLESLAGLCLHANAHIHTRYLFNFSSFLVGGFI